MTISVFLVDDQELVRAGFAMLIDSQPDLEVAGQAGDGSSAVRALTGQGRWAVPDVVLMDVRMPGTDGVTATQRLVEAGLTAKIIVLTTFDLDEYAFAALRAGASGFLLKDALPGDLLAAIRTVHRGDAVIAPSTTRRLIDRVAPSLPAQGARPNPLAVLTGREREVFHSVARGLSNAEIARSLSMAESTVKVHVGRLLAKLGMRDRVQLVVLAYESGAVRPGGRPHPWP